jgi:polyketide biosynthesis 3-hydroxy-3-methylglutaryl-CoA synthase-like enzyme PksG
MQVGIESINIYGGKTYLDVRTLFGARNLDIARFDNLMMEKKSVGLPCEDPVTNGVNAAKPIIKELSEEERNRIEMVIASTESGLDFGKSMSTYLHHYLGLNRNCRLFEIKQACYGGTAALQTAANFVAANVSPGAKVLVIATDTARAAAKNTYAEPSQAVGAVAMLVSDKPEILELDLGANGVYGYEVMDTCRPEAHLELGDPDTSLLSYLDCLENSYRAYSDRVVDVDFQDSFDYLAFHTPFAGMVKGAHRMMMRKLKKASPGVSDNDFEKRVGLSLKHCVRIGNIYSATLYLALCSVIDYGDFAVPRRVGLFSYGSGCSSEFYSGILTKLSHEKLIALNIREALDDRYELTIEEYDSLLDLNMEWIFGIQNKEIDISSYANVYARHFEGKGLLVLKRVKNYHREYVWS